MRDGQNYICRKIKGLMRSYKGKTKQIDIIFAGIEKEK